MMWAAGGPGPPPAVAGQLLEHRLLHDLATQYRADLAAIRLLGIGLLEAVERSIS
jgi:hypothetical protein